ncbi:hypothetical protein niasHT_015621 [Heterodera trifolii]|uniref:Cytochrome P450 n=1 Tax=Heterodera trifolii TaxID=157864 RepID=A0ABD2L461_9BILA
MILFCSLFSLLPSLLPLSLLFLLSLFLFYHFHWKLLNLPPGPIPLPFFGNAPQFSGKNRYNKFKEWTQKFGPIYTVWLGELPVVVFTDFEMIKQCFTKDEFAGRNFLNNHFRMFSGGEVNGVIRTEGEQWKQLRKFTLKALRDYGLEKGATEAMVLEAIFTLIDKVEGEVNSGNSELSIDRKVDLMTGSVINRMLFGFSFYGDRYKTFTFLKDALDVEQEYFISLISQMIEARPWLRHLPYFSKKYNENEWTLKELFKFFDGEIERRVELRKSADGYSGDRTFLDILDQFIDQMEEQTEEKQSESNFIKLKYLSTLCYDIFLAGQETTSNTLNFLILFMLLDQKSQQELHAELDSLAKDKNGQMAPEGRGTVFRMEDRLRLPYTHAVVNESLRLSNLLPLNLHKVLQTDVEIGGHKLKKGTAVVNQIATVLFDDKIFPDHEKFIPSRFLEEDGKMRRVDELIPFGIGKRSCPGETLGRMELVLFTANFFHKFHVYPCDPLNPPKFEKRQTFAVKLADYKCKVTKRN